jgi:hypothetical protein
MKIPTEALKPSRYQHGIGPVELPRSKSAAPGGAADRLMSTLDFIQAFPPALNATDPTITTCP